MYSWPTGLSISPQWVRRDLPNRRTVLLDTWALVIGGLVLLAAFLVLGAACWSKVVGGPRTAGRSRRQRPSRAVGLLADLGASPSTLIGVRRALQRGGGRSTVPVASASWFDLAVTALCATAVFGSSLTHLITTPSLYGQRFDLDISVNSAGTPAQAEQLVNNIERERTVTGITAGLSGDVDRKATPWPPWGRIDPRVAALDDNQRPDPRPPD